MVEDRSRLVKRAKPAPARAKASRDLRRVGDRDAQGNLIAAVLAQQSALH
jgi:hypothetical protein